jgi:hypothetical protein
MTAVSLGVPEAEPERRHGWASLVEEILEQVATHESAGLSL